MAYPNNSNLANYASDLNDYSQQKYGNSIADAQSCGDTKTAGLGALSGLAGISAYGLSGTASGSGQAIQKKTLQVEAANLYISSMRILAHVNRLNASLFGPVLESDDCKKTYEAPLTISDDIRQTTSNLDVVEKTLISLAAKISSR
jgi:hypothetical protein